MKKLCLPFLIVIIAALLRLWMLNTPDVTEDERHYIVDAQRLLNKDPYISVRYHSRNHPQPSIGHPFFYQIEQALIFKYFGLSVYTSRLPNALSGIAIVAILFLFTKQLGGRVATLAAFFVTIIPMAVRYSRNAQLDTVFTFWITLCALSIWRYLNEKKKYWLIISGTAAGLTISTKLNGVYILSMVLLLLLFAEKKKSTLKNLKKVFAELIWVIVPCAVVAFILNDPSAYIDGILNPSFEPYSFFSRQFLFERVPIMLSTEAFLNFLKANFLLLSPLFLLVFIASWFYLIFKEKGKVKRFLILWMLPLLNIFVIHGFNADGIYGWIPFLAPTMLGTSYVINKLESKKAKILVLMLTVVMLPYLFLYGLQASALPFEKLPLTHNRSIHETFYQSVIDNVNKITPKNGKVFLLPQANYPIFALRPDISWNYYDSENSDVLVVDNPKNVKNISPIKFIKSFSAHQDGQLITRFLFVKE